MENKINTRNIVLSMLTDTLEKGCFSHKVMNRYMDDVQMTSEDRRFVKNLYSGTLERQLFLDFILNGHSTVRVNKMKPVIRNILRLSIYQLYFMDSIPDRAVLSEAQKLCEKRGFHSLKPFVNGVLRSITRNKDVKAPDNIKYSVPEWIYEKVVREYGKESAELFFEDALKFDNMTSIRLVNMNDKEGNIGIADVVDELEKEGCHVEKAEGFKKALKISVPKQINELKAFKEGYIFPQDISSMLVAEVISNIPDINKEALILDVCAAPGGKSIGLADEYPDAQIISMDISEEKTALIDENIKRLKKNNVKTVVNDALKPLKEYIGKADILVCDLPCSGLGVLKRKPDIKMRLKEEDISELSRLQKQILKASADYLKTGGYLLYSTCTITGEENQENAEYIEHELGLKKQPLNTEGFLKLLNDTQKEEAKTGCLQLLPGINGTDGFFISLFKKQLSD